MLYRYIYTVSFMYPRAILCTFRISVDFCYVPVGGRGGRERGGAGEGGGLEKGGWRRGGDGLERGGWNLYCTGTVGILTFLVQMALATLVFLDFQGPPP
jgi:hypothetical protein